MMALCRATKRDGSPCTLNATDANGYCWAHDPANAAQRRRAASRAGSSRSGKELARLKDAVRGVIEKVERGELDRNDGAVMLQGYRVLKDLVELERRAKVTDELAEEIARLKERFGDGQQTAR